MEPPSGRNKNLIVFKTGKACNKWWQILFPGTYRANVQLSSFHHIEGKTWLFFSFAKKLHHSRKNKKTRLFFYRYCEIRQKLSTSAAILLLPPALFLLKFFFFPRLLFSPYPPTPHSLRGEKEWVDGVNSETCPMHSRTPKEKKDKRGGGRFLFTLVTE